MPGLTFDAAFSAARDIRGLRAMFAVALKTMIRATWGAATWRATAHVLVGGVLGSVTMSVVLTLLVVGTGLAVTVVIPALALAALLGCVRGFTALQRSRFTVFLGADPAASRSQPAARPWPSDAAGERPRRLLARAWTWVWTMTSAAATWRQVAYHLLAGVIGLSGFITVACAWWAALVLCTLPLHGWALPADGPLGWNLRGLSVLTALTGLGIVALLTAPWVARGTAAVDLAAARALLGPSRAELTRRVTGLAQSRAAPVDAERRRIERDLHDGAQQRLVALAMNLGIARASLSDRDLPPPAREALTQAHAEAKQALAELRGFVRGLHPAVLNDRGLDAALSGLAARSPVPVRLRVELAQRPSPTTEAVAYFVASEALTNVAKHAGASQVDVTVCQRGNGRQGGRLSLVIVDDGGGGARPEAGTGLRGLAHRVASVDGTLIVTSPPGGPTSITVELPCAL
jgi:signal transduction histidine kinase